MGYTTYDFYKNTYYGDSLTESSFPMWNEKASDKLKWFCNGDINADELSSHSIEIQKATCVLADILFQIDFKKKNTHDSVNGNIKSMSSGGQSISFGSNETAIDVALADNKALNRIMFDSISEYLDNTNLLYKGV